MYDIDELVDDVALLLDVDDDEVVVVYVLDEVPQQVIEVDDEVLVVHQHIVFVGLEVLIVSDYLWLNTHHLADIISLEVIVYMNVTDIAYIALLLTEL